METPSSNNVSTKLERIAKQAREAPEMAFQTLAHHIDVEWLREAYRRTRKDGALGVDRQTAAAYASNLEENLQSLHSRVKSGTYRAPPVLRAHIPKGTGSETRPIGIPTFEDKVLQRAVAMVLQAVYEQDFLDCSYGSRPKRSAHQALDALYSQATWMGGAWIIEIDIRKFFDTLDHKMLREVLQRRVRDGALLRLIGKWLNAGVLEEGALSYPDTGTPQGGVISPILAKIFLHEVLDTWFYREVTPRLLGTAQLYRYVDDAVLLFREERDAKRVMVVLPKRFGKFGLALHPDKTRLLDFRRPDRCSSDDDDEPKGPQTFDLLGFTHFWGKSRLGKWTVKRKTAKDRFRRALKRISEWCKKYRHAAVRAQHAKLVQKLRGHYQYYGITGNSRALDRFRYRVKCAWQKWLNRRSERAKMTWERMDTLLKRYPLPLPKVVHSYLNNHVANP